MVNKKSAGIKNPVQSKAPGLSSLLTAGALLIISAAPAFADANTDQLNEMSSKLQSLQRDVSQMASGMAQHSDDSNGLQMHGFMDAGFAGNTDNNLAVHPKGFNIGALSFYLTPRFSDQVKALVEPNFEISSDGSLSTDLERMEIGYTFSDAATLWGGRFHTPYGYWNTAFHHGALMQTSILRPRFLAFEDQGGVLPAHMVGLWSTGKIKAEGGKMTYDIFAGNGPRIVMGPADSAGNQTLGTQDINLNGDSNKQTMAGFNLGYEFSRSLDGLRLAIHGLGGDVDDDSDGTIAAGSTKLNKTTLNAVGGSLVYLGNDWEIMGENYYFSDKDKSGSTGTHKSRASYLQIGRGFNKLTPFVRYERTSFDQKDNYFNLQASGQSYTRQSLGLRYNLNQKAALKFEWLSSRFKADTAGASPRTADNYSEWHVQYAIGF
jgi:hypothetical protein